MEFRILGPLEVDGPQGEIDVRGRKQRALLSLLLLHANEVVPAGRLVELLWGDDPPADASKALQVHISRLRRALGAGDVVRTRAGGYVVAVEPERFDLLRFESLAARGAELVADDPAAAREVLGVALALWRGPALGDLANEAFAEPELARLDELRLTATETRIDADLMLGRHAALVGELEALVARQPLRERLRAQLMLALYRSGRQADALDAYRDARRTLVDELGIDPGKALQELESAILRQDAALDLPSAPVTPAAPDSHRPRPGRRAAGIFVGRERELHDLAAALEDAAAGRGRLFLISGDAGSGKTRLADEVASRAKESGALILWGRCWRRGGAPAYWPWKQALEPVADDVPPLDGEVDETARFQLFVDVAAGLGRAASRQPLLVVLDDLDHADEPSLLLLEFVAGELAEMAVAVVGTFRERRGQPDGLKGLTNHTAHHHLRLGPLSAQEVTRLAELAGTDGVDAAALRADTGGNPRRVWQRVR